MIDFETTKNLDLTREFTIKTSDDKTNEDQTTTAYVHWLPNVHLAGFAPALAALIFDSLCRFKTANAPANETYRVTVPPMTIASVVMRH